MATIHQFARKSETATLRCTSCGKTTDVVCSCGASYEYIAPGKLAAKAVEDNPGMSDRDIADKIGVSDTTVLRARKSTASKEAVEEKRTGKDGKTRRMPKRRERRRRNDATAEAKAAAAVLDQGKTYKEAATESGLDGSVQIMKIAAAREEGRREVSAELLDAAAAENFSEKGALRIDDAIRIHKARLDKQFEQRVNEEVRRRIDAADDTTRKHVKELHLQNLNLQRIVTQRGVFTETQYRQMLMLCHPDSSAGPKLKAELLQVLVENKIRLIKPDK
jgi:hypothetical protein